MGHHSARLGCLPVREQIDAFVRWRAESGTATAQVNAVKLRFNHHASGFVLKLPDEIPPQDCLLNWPKTFELNPI